MAWVSNGDYVLLQLSQRVRDTDAPIIVKTKQFIGSRQDVLSLAQGEPPSCQHHMKTLS